jgi:outer membrane PBP1 activator LpoA protein
VLALTCSLVTCACTPQRSTRPDEAPIDPAANAERLLDAGEFEAAAQEYLRAAQQSGAADGANYRMLASHAYLDAGLVDQARNALVGVPEIRNNMQIRQSRILLEGRLALATGAKSDARALLSRISPEQLPRQNLGRYYTVVIETADLDDNRLQEAIARVNLEPFLKDALSVRDNRMQLWDALNAATLSTLNRGLSSADPVLAGWIELAMLAQTQMHRSSVFALGIASWETRHPSHPAQVEIVPWLLQMSKDLSINVRKVALLLPLTGRFSGAGTAIRDGFLTAWYQDVSNPQKPTVRIYDVQANAIGNVYHAAVNEGADIVVGPLEKASVEALASLDSIPVTTIALNQIEAEINASRHPRLYQFGLPPEDEARQLAERAWFDGHVRAVALVPKGDWGERVFRAFSEQWGMLGGEILERQTYAPESEDFATPVEAILNVDRSAWRAQELRRILQHDIKSEPRRRQDADFVFMAAYPMQARQLRPQLDFHRATEVPVYTTSDAFTGVVDREHYNDLNGVRFGDMPWLLGAPDNEHETLRIITSNWAAEFNAFGRLFALGLDAYRLIPELGRLRVQRFARLEGATGTLRIDEFGRVHRQLLWAQVVDGVPRPIEGRPAAPGQ